MNTTSIGAEALQHITCSLDAGRTVYICTMTRATKITPKTAQKWRQAGHELFKLASDGALLMASGRSFVRLTSGSAMLVGIKVQ